MRPAADATLPAYRLLLGLGAVGILILAVGVGQFVHFEPLRQRSGVAASITGVYDWDAKTGAVTGANKDHFRTDEPFAAVVDWSKLPPDLVVGGDWFASGFTVNAGGVGPAPAKTLVGTGAVPVNSRFDRFPSGHYLFAVERYSGGRPVEVLARKTILVVGSR